MTPPAIVRRRGDESVWLRVPWGVELAWGLVMILGSVGGAFVSWDPAGPVRFASPTWADVLQPDPMFRVPVGFMAGIGGHPTALYVESLAKRFEMSASRRDDP